MIGTTAVFDTPEAQLTIAIQSMTASARIGRDGLLNGVDVSAAAGGR